MTGHESTNHALILINLLDQIHTMEEESGLADTFFLGSRNPSSPLGLLCFVTHAVFNKTGCVLWKHDNLRWEEKKKENMNKKKKQFHLIKSKVTSVLIG